MKVRRQIANICFALLLALSLLITWKAVGYAGDLAYAGKQPIIWLNLLAFAGAIILVVAAIIIRNKYGK